MPPPLHPRSIFTSTLFATSLFASFFVVALPHVLPCPAPRVAFADGEGMVTADGTAQKRKRRRKRVQDGHEESEGRHPNETFNNFAEEQDVERMAVGGLDRRKVKRECPVPKPGGLVGAVLGFRESSSGKGGG